MTETQAGETRWIALLQGRVCRGFLLLVAAVFFLFRFLHLAADYPTSIRWEDGILTDEGWYASAAVNLHAWGFPIVSGDMNTAVLLPVWPVLAHASFALFGYHIEVLRGLAVVTTLISAGLLSLLLRRYQASHFVPLFLALLAVNPWAFVISRGAFLEAPMLVFFFGALLVAQAGCGQGSRHGRRIVIAGLLFGLAVLTKSSAVPMAPVLAFAVLQAEAYRWREALWKNALIFLTAALPVGLFFFTVSRHFATDALFYLSTIPSHTTFGAHALLAQLTRPFRYAAGSDHLLFLFDVVLLLASMVLPRFRRCWGDPLFAFAGVWSVTVLLALVALNNVMVHYLALLIPALLLLAIAVLSMPAQVVLPRWKAGFLVLLGCDTAINALQVSSFVLHPRYSFHDAAQQIEAAIGREPHANRVVLGDNAAEVALEADIQPLNIFAHAASVTRQVDRYAPDWWLAYEAEDYGTCYRVVLSQAYLAQEHGAWIIPHGRRLVLYRLYRIPGATLSHELSAAKKQACRSPFVADQREFAEVPVDPRFAR